MQPNGLFLRFCDQQAFVGLGYDLLICEWYMYPIVLPSPFTFGLYRDLFGKLHDG